MDWEAIKAGAADLAVKNKAALVAFFVGFVMGAIIF